MSFTNLPGWILRPCGVMHLLLTAFSVIFMPCTSFPVHNELRATEFLEKYDHLKAPAANRSKDAALPSKDILTEAFKERQRFEGLKQTGDLDSATLRLMNSPRNGVQNESDNSTLIREKRYVLQSSRWFKTPLTYKVSKYSSKLKDRLKIDSIIKRALKVWSDVAGVTFLEKRNGRVDIDIRFVVRDHGDANPFSGPGDALAHAFGPKHGGDVHFDDEENWTTVEGNGTALFHVAAHELGHSLGIAHSLNRNAVMYEHYESSSTLFSLHEDDIKAVQALYGSRDAPVLGESFPDTSDAQDMCSDSKIDAATRIQNGNTYVFRGAFYWKIERDGIATGYPRRIKEDWGGLEENLDAAFTWPNGKTFFVKDDKYWRFSNMGMDLGYPRSFKVGFDGLPDSPDAAFVWGGNDKTYFFKGSQFWRYDGSTDPPVSEEYPKPISNWRGLPNDIDGALQWENGRTYFFKGKEYYKFDDKEFKVDSSDPPYPRLTSVYWFHCSPVQ